MMVRKKKYAVVNPPFEGKHRKPQDPASLARRKVHWQMRKLGLGVKTLNRRG